MDLLDYGKADGQEVNYEKMSGAETLLGNGDMQFYPQGQRTPLRVQGTFIVIQHDKASVGMLQRFFKIGFNRRHVLWISLERLAWQAQS